MQFVSHLFKELVDDGIPHVALTGCCKIIQKLNLCLLLQINIFLIKKAVYVACFFLTCPVIKQELL